MKNYKPMECPVCHEYYFDDDVDIESCEIECNENYIDYCPNCGWQYDLYQSEHPDESNLTNVLSLNEYIKWFNEKIEKNPDYNYCDENYVETPHQCPVCGKYEFKDISSFEICPYCGWQDDELMENDADNWAGCSNPLCLNDYRKMYMQKLVDDPNYRWKK